MSYDETSAATEDSTLEAMTRDECLEFLADQSIGRVAVGDFNAAPLVVPVNYVLVGETVVFRTDAGSKFRLAVLADHPVSFEIDGVEPGRRAGWSVLVQGQAEEFDESDAARLPLYPWAPGPKSHWVRIVPGSITGRRIRLAPVSGSDVRGYL